MDDIVYSPGFWDTLYFKVEGKLFCVPRDEFDQSSEVFASMFLLPAGPETKVEGLCKEHPIVLEGHTADEFAALLKVMYPKASSLISGSKIELSMKKQEWVSALKLSTMWDMAKIRNYAIHKLSTECHLSAIEKVHLARTHGIAKWLAEGIASLVNPDHPPLSYEDTASLGWRTSALILWIQANAVHNTSDDSQILHFRKDSIKCASCASTTSLLAGNHNCATCSQILRPADELTYDTLGLDSTTGLAASDRLVNPNLIRCIKCTWSPIQKLLPLYCPSCSSRVSEAGVVRVTPKRHATDLANEVFGQEIEEYGPM